jgi:Enhancer of rudimentary
MDSHTILLVQTVADKYSRTFYDFPTLNGALAGICDLFENRLRELNRASGLVELRYDIADLFRFIDSLPDLSILILDPSSRQYTPYGKNFIKNHLFRYCAERRAGN